MGLPETSRYCKTFRVLLFYLKYDKDNNYYTFGYRDLFYKQIIAFPNLLFNHLLKLIILAKVFILYTRIDGKDSELIKKVLKYTYDKGEENFDAEAIYDFCIHFKAKNNKDDVYMKTPLAGMVSKYIKHTIADPMRISTKTFKKYLYMEELTMERLAAMCFCLELDTYITGELMRKAGFVFSPYSPNKKIRAIYSMFSFSKRLSIKSLESEKSQNLNAEKKELSEPNSGELLEDFEKIFKKYDLDIDLCPTRKTRSDNKKEKK